jgi:LCP family protein required for cell wall assembly
MPRWRRRRAILLGIVAALLVLTLGALVGVYAYGRSLNAGLKRTDAFAGLSPSHRPAHTVVGALNLLVLGTDSRDPSGDPGRSDTMMLMHLDADHRHAYVISIPRDTWVYVPPAPDGGNGDTMAKINAAYAWGGVPLAVQTVEQFTGVRVDHVVRADFAGFQKVIDAMGGVNLDIDQTITSIFPPYRQFKQGRQHLGGAEALDYVRQRYQFDDGDLTREKHQQQLLAALLNQAADAGTLTDLGRLDTLLRSVTACLTVDEGFDLVDVALQLRNLRGPDVTYLTSPVAGTGWEGDEAVVVPDAGRSAQLYAAVRQDTVGAYLSAGSGQPDPAGAATTPTDPPTARPGPTPVG